LDLLRLVAAFVVFTNHCNNNLMAHMLGGPLLWGRESVAVFFVLSGFVISYVSSTRETSAKEYFVARAARIYPVAILCVLLIMATDVIGNQVNAGYYDHLANLHDSFYRPPSVSALLSYLTFTNQLWFTHAIFGTGEPYWSLGFEVQYYVFFGILCFCDRKKLPFYVGLWALVCGPKILMYLPIWLMGVYAQKMVRHQTIQSAKVGFALFLASGAIFVAGRLMWGALAHNMFKTYPPSEEVFNFLYFTSIGLATTTNIVAFDAMFRSSEQIFPARLASVIKWLAGGSFTLYLAHQPLLVLAAATVDRVGASPVAAALGAGCVLALAFLLAEVAERPKKIYANAFRALLSRVG
jgi:peptidoglycan/LPS O-acetylase OafA/YrhL